MAGHLYCRVMLFVIIAVFIVTHSVDCITIQVEPRSEPVWFLEGGSLLLTCTVTGDDSINPRWLKDGSPVDSDLVSMSKESTSSHPKTTVIFKKEYATLDDSGSYLCSAGNDDVFRRVDMFTITSRDVNLTVGYQTTLVCEIEPDFYTTSITWLKGSTPLVKIPELDGRVTFGQFNRTASIVNSKTSDAGIYTCLVKFYPETTMEQTFSNNVGVHVDGITIQVEPRSEPVWFLEGGSLLLTCTVTGDGNIKPQWLKDESPVESDLVSMSKDSTSSHPKTTLTFKKEDATLDDSGSYTCLAGTNAIIKKVDMFSVTSRDVNLTLGFQTTLACFTEPYYEKTSITWLKGSTPLVKIPELEGRLTLGQFNKTASIMNSKTSDAGIYTCIIHFNPDTPMEQTFSQTVGVQGKPYVVTGGSSMAQLKNVTNTSITLTCPPTGYPIPEVFWLRGDDTIEASARYMLYPVNGVPDAKLEIKDRTEKDFGAYVCVLENSMGKSQLTFNLKENNGNGVDKISWPGMTLGIVWLLHVLHCKL